MEVIPGDGQPEGAGPPDSLEPPVIVTGGSEKGPEANDTHVFPEETGTPAEESVLIEAAASPEVTEAIESLAAPALAPEAAPPEEEVAILVKFKGSVGKADIETAINECGGKKDREIQKIGVHVVKVPASKAASAVEKLKAKGNVEYASLPVKFNAAGITDPLFNSGDQWALDKTAWDDAEASGMLPVNGPAIIAILDTGVDETHPDLDGRMRSGWSTITDTAEAANSDPNGHGTALAGIAAAEVNNGEGIAGVAYDSSIEIMSIQVLGADGTGTDLDIIDGIENATVRGANVILMGFSSPYYSPALDAAIATAWSEGVVVVAATGNDGSTLASYPAGMAHVLGVTSTDINDLIPSNSNTGSALVAAPGVGIITTGSIQSYTTISGTSASAAHVAGLAALLMANVSNSNIDTFDQIRGAVDEIPGGINPITGQSYGRINVSKALGVEIVPPTLPPTEIPTTGPVPTYVIGNVNSFMAFDAVSQTWTPGNVNGYSEGDCIPVRILATGPEVGLEYIYFDYKWKSAGAVGIEDLLNFEVKIESTGVNVPYESGAFVGPTYDGAQGYYVMNYSKILAGGLASGVQYNITFCALLSTEATEYGSSSLSMNLGKANKNLPVANIGAIEPADTITVYKYAYGPDEITPNTTTMFTFTSEPDLPGYATFNLYHSESITAQLESSGLYTITETPPAGTYWITTVTFSGDTDGGSSVSADGKTAYVDSDPNEDIVVTFRNVEATFTVSIDCPDDISVQCIGDVPDPDTSLVTVTTGCEEGYTVEWISDVSDGLTCPETITRTYRATENCSGLTTDCTQLIIVDDTTAPSITCPADVTIECTGSTHPDATGYATGSDTCGTVTITYSDSMTDGCGDTGIITRTWTATDSCSNTATCVQTITVVDTTPPVIACPADAIAPWGDPTDPAHTGSATATDNCDDDVAISFTDGTPSTSTDADCYEFTRTWTATDNCGNTDTCTQIIYVKSSSICGVKFSDVNLNGIRDTGELGIAGFKIELYNATGAKLATAYTDTDGEYCFNHLKLGTYTVKEVVPTDIKWISTTSTSIPVTLSTYCVVSPDHNFGNICLGYGGGTTIGGWSNKNGQTTLTEYWYDTIRPSGILDRSSDSIFDGLPHTLNSGDYYFNTPADVVKFLRGAKANILDGQYMLAAQWLALQFGVLTERVDPESLVYVGDLNGNGLDINDFWEVQDILSYVTDNWEGWDKTTRMKWQAIIESANSNKAFFDPTRVCIVRY